MEDNSVILLVIIITYSIGVFFYKRYLPQIKGSRGESKVAKLLRRLDQNEYKVFNDVHLKYNERTTQIDHLIISTYGIFVIETKNYEGWIHGNENSEYWTQTFYKKKQKFRNPIKQNWAHIYFLKEILSAYPQVRYHSIIVFVGKAELKNIHSSIPVIYKKQLIKTVKEERPICLSVNQVEKIRDHLNGAIILDEKEKRRHIKSIKKNISARKENIKKKICPNCGNELVVRKGKYGKFYGCSNFPACRFTAKF